MFLPATFVVTALALAACGGGGGGNATPPVAAGSNGGANSGSQNNARASVSIAIPARPVDGNTRSAQYISASTQSMTFSTVNGQGQATQIASFDTTASSPGCSSVAGGGTLCNETFGAPSGSTTFSVVAFDATGGKGNVLSKGTVQATLTAGTNNTIPLVLNGNATKATVVLGSSSLPVGTAGTTTVGIMATDAQNNVIVGPGAFATPIALSITGDPYTTLTLSANTISAPGQLATLSYSGNSLVGASIAASATGLTGTGATFAGSGYAVTNINIPGNDNDFIDPLGVVALPGGGAAFDYFVDCCWSYAGIGVVDAGGNVTLLMGDTYDPLVTPSPTAAPTASPSPGASPTTTPSPTFTASSFNPTIVPGMLAWPTEWRGEAPSDLGVGAFGTVFFGAEFNHDDNVVGGFYYCNIGAIQGINPLTHAVVKTTVLKGSPYQVRSDSTGAIWFTEWTGMKSAETSNGSGGLNYGPYTPLISGDGTTAEYGIGKLNPDGSLAFEIPFSQVGIPASSNPYPGDISMSPDGTTLYIGDYGDTSRIIKIPIAGGTVVGQTATFANIIPGTGDGPMAVVGGPNGQVVWTTDDEPSNNYYLGFIPAAATFGSAAVVNFPFTAATDAEGESGVYADGSYWFADDSNAGLMRLQNFSATGPLQTYIATQPTNQSGWYNCGVGGGNGAIWAAQCEWYAASSIVRIVYGAPGSSSQINSTTRIVSGARNRAAGSTTSKRNPFKVAKGQRRGKFQHRKPASPYADRMMPQDKIRLQSQGKLRGGG
jgi:hypothetical protein